MAKETEDKKSREFYIPSTDEEFRKLIKKIAKEELQKLKKEDLERMYYRAKTAYPNPVKRISKSEKDNLYVIQEGLFGKLDSKTKASLENIGETLVKKPEKRKKAVNYKLSAGAGATIVKHWKGKKLEVKITDEGFEFETKEYKSLSQLAKEIAGYAVSGPIFFGLKKPSLSKPNEKVA